MPYTPVLISRPGYPASHYDFGYGVLGDFKTDQARRANTLAMAGKYQEAAAIVNSYSGETRDYILTYLQQSLSAERYREVLRYVKGVSTSGGGGASLSKAWDFIKGQYTTGGGGAVPSSGPNYLLWGGVAVGGILVLLLLTRKPKQRPTNSAG